MFLHHEIININTNVILHERKLLWWYYNTYACPPLIKVSFLTSTVEGVVLRPELRHLSGRQIHRDRVRGQEGHRVRGHLLERDEAPASALVRRLLTCGLQHADVKHTLGIDGAVDKRMLVLKEGFLYFFFFFFVEGYIFWGYTFFVTIFFFFSLPPLRIFGCEPMKRRFISENLASPRRPVKSVHIGLNKRHFIYIYYKIYIFSCPGCTCDQYPTLSYALIFEWDSGT